MPKTKFQSIIFTALMVFCMVFCLIFFLITTSMDTDRGLARRLPPPPEKDQKLDDAKKK